MLLNVVKKNSVKEKILLLENERIVNDDSDIATIFNTYFNRITETLDIPSWNNSFIPKHNGKVKDAIGKFEEHPSIHCIQQSSPKSECFDFVDTTVDEVYQIKR